MPTETEIYTAKEAAKEILNDALRNYIAAADAYFDYDDDEEANEIEEMLHELGKPWDVNF
jgi:hypothetical protein